MKAQFKVTSAQTNGTLKQSQKRNTLRSMMSLFVLLLVSIAAMSFQNDDTTKATTGSALQPNDSCCTVTIVNGTQRITITRVSALKSMIRINDMDVQTWVNGLEAYSFKKLNADVVVGADENIDAEFTAAELVNRRLAAEFTRSVGVTAAEADQQLNNTFLLQIAAPEFGQQLKTELQTADAGMDAEFLTDEWNKQEAVRFRKSVLRPAEDELMDMTINASVLSPIKTSIGAPADLLMDAQLIGTGSSNFKSGSVKAADLQMDAQIRK